MKVRVKWFITGNITEFDEADALLGPQTTILELKGLIQIRFGYAAKNVVIIYKRLLENDSRLRDIGLVDSASCKEIVLTVHVVESGSLESSDLPDEEDDEDIQEFTHEDFEVAMRMLGKDVPVGTDRLKELREAPPRSRPEFLNSSEPAPASSSQAKTQANDLNYTMKGTRIHEIFANMEYGMRSIEAEDYYSIQFPGVADPYQYWDMRLPENETYQETYCNHNASEVCFELFYFGSWGPIKDPQDGARFASLVCQLLQSKLGIRARAPVPPREAGCMYPLIAIAVVMSETEGMELGKTLFEDFGKKAEGSVSTGHAPRGDAPARPTGGCGQQ